MKKKITARRKEERKTRNNLKVLNRQEQETGSETFCNFVEIGKINFAVFDKIII